MNPSRARRPSVLFTAMRRALVLAGVVSVAVAFLATGPVAAAPKPRPATGFSIERMTLQRHIGHFLVAVQVEEGGEGVVLMLFGHPYSVDYLTTDGAAEGTTITARFGNRGSLHMTFDRPVSHAKRCGGRSETRGSFKGELEFHGEGGFLDFDINSMEGQVETVSDRCPAGVRPRQASEGEVEEEESPAMLAATTPKSLPRESWAAVDGRGPRGHATGVLSASREERKEGCGSIA